MQGPLCPIVGLLFLQDMQNTTCMPYFFSSRQLIPLKEFGTGADVVVKVIAGVEAGALCSDIDLTAVLAPSDG